ncbi:3-isopropylmalate dehydrogenase [Microaerobacter geothermalis]|uniref:3-isopropylmalate dehydrogenase n=1 Tax=Microaerobacter geothermalis TaxID=674972 RepID=UPI001F3C12C1|nr:3-isopropylmalate dehydrogenase [Microaerobacter geothermalis]MCF6093003.1 3-isopropylmalate dehydrogenase [Microaerobacter geothermalis]
MANFRITILPGDGIGPEIVAEGVKVLKAIEELYHHHFEIKEALIGGISLDQTGIPLPDETVASCQASDAVLLGAVGGPKWDQNPGHLRPEAGLLGIRKKLGLYANLRPATAFESLVDASTLKPEVISGVDLLVVRELTGGIYFGHKERREVNGVAEAVDTLHYNEKEIERIAHTAFRLARLRRNKVTSVDKANVMESSRLWREVVIRVAKEYPDVELEHVLVDACAMQLIRTPKHFDVIVTENLFGDILSDEAAMLTGSIGMLASASLGEGTFGLYEPVHGSAPDIAGQGIANPIATILSVAMMLKYSLGLKVEADLIELAVKSVLEKGYRTGDIASTGDEVKGTVEMGQLIIEEMKALKK